MADILSITTCPHLDRFRI